MHLSPFLLITLLTTLFPPPTLQDQDQYQAPCISVAAHYTMAGNLLAGFATATSGNAVDCTFTNVQGTKLTVTGTPTPVLQWKPACATGAIMLQTTDGIGPAPDGMGPGIVSPPLDGWYLAAGMQGLPELQEHIAAGFDSYVGNVWVGSLGVCKAPA